MHACVHHLSALLLGGIAPVKAWLTGWVCALTQILLCGIEAHVCVFQTALDLLGESQCQLVFEHNDVLALP